MDMPDLYALCELGTIRAGAVKGKGHGAFWHLTKAAKRAKRRGEVRPYQTARFMYQARPTRGNP